MAEISLREAIEILESRIKSNPKTFEKAVGGKRTFTAILALLNYVKSLPEQELDKRVKVELTS